jgi:hypothetical protein
VAAGIARKIFDAYLLPPAAVQTTEDPVAVTPPVGGNEE